MIFAYTIKGHGLPNAGPPAEPLRLLTRRRSSPSSARRARRRRRRPVARFAADSRRGAAVRARRPSGCAAIRSPVAAPARGARRPRPHADGPQHHPGRRSAGCCSTSPASRPRPRAGSSRSRPDVASSPPTSAAGSTRSASGRPTDERDWFADDAETILHWRRAPDRPAHRARHRRGQPRRRCSASSARPGAAGASRCSRSARSTTRSSTAPSSRGRSASTPAASRSSSARRPGVTLAAEGGAHQSIITPSIGIEQPGCRRATSRRSRMTSSGACSTRWPARPRRTARRPTCGSRLAPVDQALAAVPADPAARERRRRQVVAGGYALRRGRRPGRHPRRDGRAHARGAGRRRPARRGSASPPTSSASPAPTCCSGRVRARGTGHGRRRPAGSSTRSSRPTAPRRWSPCSTATRTPSRSSPAINRVRSVNLGVTEFGQSGDLAGGLPLPRHRRRQHRPRRPRHHPAPSGTAPLGGLLAGEAVFPGSAER